MGRVRERKERLGRGREGEGGGGQEKFGLRNLHPSPNPQKPVCL